MSYQSSLEQTAESSYLERSNGWLRAARVGWAFLAALSLGILLTSLPGYGVRISSGLPGHGPLVEPSTGYIYLQAINSIASLVSAILSLSLSALLFRHRFENPAVAVISIFLLLYGIIMTGPLENWGLYWLGTMDFAITVQTLLMATPTLALLLLFPNGKFIPGWTGWVLVASLPWNVLALLAPVFPYRADDLTDLLVLAFFWIAMLCLGIYAQIYRYRHVSTHDERQKTRWVLFGFALWIGYLLISTYPYFYVISLPEGTPMPWWSPLTELTWWLSLNIVPVTLAIAITRSRLWNIDIVINRALVYGALTFATMALYVLVVGALGSLLNVGNSTFIAFLTTGLVAVLFQPLRERLQRGVNRLMYGERDDPVSVLRQLGAQLERTGSPRDALISITETVSRTLKLPYVAFELGQAGEIVAAYGLSRGENLRLPLTYQSKPTGYLVVAPRSPGESFSSSDLQLLENITHQAGAAAHAAKMDVDLRLSRQRLVTAREEERRRLRRDLHDGLGPNLAGMTLKLEATRNLLRKDSAKAEQIINELIKQTQGTIQDIRTLVYELRPPALDELELVGAIQGFIEKQGSARPRIDLDLPEPLPPLPAAFEVAVYRIVLEGLTNVLRHADAQQARAHISVQNDQLVVEIDDDGNGLPEDMVAGVGLASMRERAEELGGEFTVLPGRPGFHIRASLPLQKE